MADSSCCVGEWCSVDAKHCTGEECFTGSGDFSGETHCSDDECSNNEECCKGKDLIIMGYFFGISGQSGDNLVCCEFADKVENV